MNTIIADQERDRRNNFNFLRLVLATLVILSHSFELVDGNRNRELLTRIFGTLSFGELAVDGFFLLSGYLITQSWLTKPVPLQFLKSRVLRIYPAFIVCSLLCTFLVGPLAANPTIYFSQFDITRFTIDLVSLGPPTGPRVFSGQPHEELNGAMWTIRDEYFCYLLVLCFGVLGLFKNKALFFLCGMTCGVGYMYWKLGFAIDIATHHIELHHPVIQLIRLLMFFCVGGTAYLYKSNLILDPRLFICAGIFLCILMFNPILNEFGLAILGGYMLLYIAFAPISVLRKFQSLPDVSYGVYLYGWPVQKLIIWHFPDLSPWIVFFLAFLICLSLGLLSWYGIEKPCLKLKYSEGIRLNTLS